MDVQAISRAFAAPREIGGRRNKESGIARGCWTCRAAPMSRIVIHKRNAWLQSRRTRRWAEYVACETKTRTHFSPASSEEGEYADIAVIVQ